MAILTDLLSVSYVTEVYSRIYAPNDVLSRHFGMQIGGSNIEKVPGRQFAYDLFDNTRRVATARAPSAGPAIIAANPVGTVTGVFPRSYEKIVMDYETLHNIRVLGKDAGQRDKMGVNYVERQLRFLKQGQNGFREFQIASLLRSGVAGFNISGEDYVPTFAANPQIPIDWRIPAGNKSQLNMLGAGDIITATWANAATDIPAHINGISSAFENLVGIPMTRVYTDGQIWLNVLRNTAVQELAGAVNRPYDMYEITDDRGPDGQLTGLRMGKIAAFPWLDWYITDSVLNVNGTTAKIFDGTKAAFMPDPAALFLKMVEGSEPVKTAPWSAATEVFGTMAWLREWDEPCTVHACTVQNCLVQLPVPKGLAIGTVVF